MLLQKRSNGIYYFRWVYPPALRKLLGKRELIKSLRTSSKSQALARAGAFYMAVEDLKKTGGDVSDSSLDESLKTKLAHSYREDVPRLFKLALDASKFYKALSFSDVGAKLEELSKCIELFKRAKTNVNGEYAKDRKIYDITEKILESFANTPVPSLNQILGKSGLDEQLGTPQAIVRLEDMIADGDVPKKMLDPERVKMSAGLVAGLWANRLIAEKGQQFKIWPELYARYLKDATDLFYCIYDQIHQTLNSAGVRPELPHFLRVIDDSAPFLTKTTESSLIRFGELYAKFLAHKIADANLSQKMQNDYNDYVKTFLFAVGDKPITEISKKM